MAIIVLVVIGGMAFGNRGGSTPSPTSPATSTRPTETPGPLSASASCSSPDSVDASGSPTTFAAGNVLDGRADTAWRCAGSGIGEQLRIDLGRSTSVTAVGLIPGYAKTDPVDATDRYAQNRRVSVVRYTFDDGSTVTQSLDTSVSNRSAQTTSVPAVRTRRVTITILDSVSGSVSNGRPAMDKVAISEVTVS